MTVLGLVQRASKNGIIPMAKTKPENLSKPDFRGNFHQSKTTLPEINFTNLLTRYYHE